MTYKEQIFISIGCVTFESLHTFEKIYLHKSRNIHGFLMGIERKATTYFMNEKSTALLKIQKITEKTLESMPIATEKIACKFVVQC